MVESLVALVFLGVTAGSVLTAVSYCDRQENYARHREAIMEILRTKIDEQRSATTGSGISNGTVTTNPTVAGIQGTVTVTVTVSTVSGFVNVKQIAASASWTEVFQGKSRTDSMSFSTWVKPNDT